MDNGKTGKFIQELRNEKKMTQAQLGELLGVENKVISKWEKGNITPSIVMLIEMSHIFGVLVEELIKGTRIDIAKKSELFQDILTYNNTKNIEQEAQKQHKKIIRL